MNHNLFIFMGVLFWIIVLLFLFDKMRKREKANIAQYQHRQRVMQSMALPEFAMMNSVMSMAQKVVERMPVPVVVKKVKCSFCDTISLESEGRCPSCGAPLPEAK